MTELDKRFAQGDNVLKASNLDFQNQNFSKSRNRQRKSKSSFEPVSEKILNLANLKENTESRSISRKHSKKECLNIENKENSTQIDDYEHIKLRKVNGIKRGMFSGKNTVSSKNTTTDSHCSRHHTFGLNLGGIGGNSQGNQHGISRSTSQNGMITMDSMDDHYDKQQSTKRSRNGEGAQKGLARRNGQYFADDLLSANVMDFPMGGQHSEDSSPKVNQIIKEESKVTKKNKRNMSMSILENNLLKQLENHNTFEPIKFNNPEVSLNKRQGLGSKNDSKAKIDSYKLKESSATEITIDEEQSQDRSTKKLSKSQKPTKNLYNNRAASSQNIMDTSSKKSATKTRQNTEQTSYSPTFNFGNQTFKKPLQQQTDYTDASEFGNPPRHKCHEPNNTFRPMLSKKSLAIASQLGDPMARLVEKKTDNGYLNKEQGYDLKECTFTPKINRKSRY